MCHGRPGHHSKDSPSPRKVEQRGHEGIRKQSLNPDSTQKRTKNHHKVQNPTAKTTPSVVLVEESKRHRHGGAGES